MLVLTRRQNEKIIILTEKQEVIDIQITEIRGGQVKIGLEAPESYLILREELIKNTNNA